MQALGTVHIPDATPESELSQVLAILGALAAEYDKSTLVAVLQGLSPQVLADCVIANMAHLPAADTIAGTGSSSGLAGLMQVACIHSFIHLCRLGAFFTHSCIQPHMFVCSFIHSLIPASSQPRIHPFMQVGYIISLIHLLAQLGCIPSIIHAGRVHSFNHSCR